ncbi:MAG TPA: response regulator [Verrucomicrobiales bacterium]|nr:response regulator [Verrucomicrobiales bacterium]
MAKILVIDDEEQIRKAMCRFLTKQGHEAQEAESGEVATDLCDKVKFDIILTDIILTDKEGLETILESC